MVNAFRWRATMRWASLLGLLVAIALGSSYWGLSGRQAETQFVRLILWGATLICCLVGVGHKEVGRAPQSRSWSILFAITLSTCAVITLVDEGLFLMLIMRSVDYSSQSVLLHLGIGIPTVALVSALGLRIAGGAASKSP